MIKERRAEGKTVRGRQVGRAEIRKAVKVEERKEEMKKKD